jgi:hypothetical protein
MRNHDPSGKSITHMGLTWQSSCQTPKGELLLPTTPSAFGSSRTLGLAYDITIMARRDTMTRGSYDRDVVVHLFSVAGRSCWKNQHRHGMCVRCSRIANL